MYLWLQLFLVAAGITLRLVISASTAGSGLNLLVNIFIWLAFFIHLLERAFSKNSDTQKYHSLNWLNVLLVAFVMLVILSFINAPYKFGAFPYLSTWITDIILFYTISRLCIQYPHLITPLITLFLSNALLITLSALYQHFKGLKEMTLEIQKNPQLLNSIPLELRTDFWGRVAAAEPFATFIYQNSLGAFLVIALPLMLSAFLFVRKPFLSLVQLLKEDYLWSKILRAGLLAITILMLFVLVKTGSKGAFVCFIASAIIIFVMHLKLSKASRIALLIAGVILFLFIFTLTLDIISAPDNPPWAENISGSLKVRFDYWRAGVKIIKDNIWTGVGLNQFGSKYLYYKSGRAGETTRAHNDYLQFASEMGLPALVISLLIWFIILKSIIYPQRKQPENPPTQSLLPFIAGAVLALVIGALLQAPLIPSLSVAIVYLIWIFTFWSLSSYLIPAVHDNIKFIRIALLSGILGFLLHCTIDFNFYVPGLSMSIWFMGALFLATADLSIAGSPQAPDYQLRLEKIIRWPFIITVTLIIILLYLITPRLIQYESLLSESKILLRSDNKEERLSGLEQARKAYLLNPYAVDPLLELAWACHYNRCIPAMSKRDLTSADNIINDSQCLEYINEAAKLSDSSPMLYYQGGLLFREHAEYLSKISSSLISDPKKRKALETLAGLYQQQAQLYFQMAQELYPTFEPGSKLKK
jgi:O-antigen ligase